MRHSMEVMTSSKSAEWYTPLWLLAKARKVMGGIDLDPASCADAQDGVRATRFLSEGGLEADWEGRVWLNPPYGRGLRHWLEKVRLSYRRGDVTQAMILVPASTEARWFVPLWEYPICFLHGRLTFSGPGQAAGGATTKGSALVYLGDRDANFEQVFADLGRVIVPDDSCRLMAREIYASSCAHGFWEDTSSMAEVVKIAMIMSEGAEALEAMRSDIMSSHLPEIKGVDEELADVVIRALDLMQHRGVDITKVIRDKMRYNLGRPRKHGKAF